jgi:hypothetical protein
MRYFPEATDLERHIRDLGLRLKAYRWVVERPCSTYLHAEKLYQVMLKIGELLWYGGQDYPADTEFQELIDAYARLHTQAMSALRVAVLSHDVQSSALGHLTTHTDTSNTSRVSFHVDVQQIKDPALRLAVLGMLRGPEAESSLIASQMRMCEAPEWVYEALCAPHACDSLSNCVATPTASAGLDLFLALSEDYPLAQAAAAVQAVF